MRSTSMQGGIRPYNRGKANRQSQRGVPSAWQRRFLHFFAIAGIVAFLLMFMVFVFRKELAATAARAWVVSEQPVPADAIVVLAGSVSARPYAAADLYLQGYAPKIVVTAMPHGGFMTPGEDYATHAILAKGVPREAFVVLRSSVNSTYDEAVSVSVWAKENNVTRILLVTDPFHTRRARWIFERVLGPWGIEVCTVAAPPKDYEIDRWWDNEFSLVEFPNDVMKYILYRLKY